MSYEAFTNETYSYFLQKISKNDASVAQIILSIWEQLRVSTFKLLFYLFPNFYLLSVSTFTFIYLSRLVLLNIV